MPSPTAADLRVLRLARTRGHGPRRERTLAVISRLGEHAAIWLALGLGGGALDRRGPAIRARWRRGAAVVGGAYALNTALKLLVRRRRPALPDLPPLVGTPTGLSFPSAHATTSFAAARVYRGLAPASGLYGLAGLLAASRVWLGVHYPSDVGAGALLGTGIGALACR